MSRDNTNKTGKENMMLFLNFITKKIHPIETGDFGVIRKPAKHPVIIIYHSDCPMKKCNIFLSYSRLYRNVVTTDSNSAQN